MNEFRDWMRAVERRVRSLERRPASDGDIVLSGAVTLTTSTGAIATLTIPGANGRTPKTCFGMGTTAANSGVLMRRQTLSAGQATFYVQDAASADPKISTQITFQWIATF